LRSAGYSEIGSIWIGQRDDCEASDVSFLRVGT
jgi:hypothetical protein